MVNEFHLKKSECSVLVPAGPGYENVSSVNQVCTTVGSLPGQSFVDGNRYVNLSFDYYFSHLWRNWGIVAAFGLFFIGCYLLFTEINTDSASESSSVIFKRGAKTPVIDEHERKGDEEKGRNSVGASAQSVSGDSETPVPSAKAQVMTDVFSWQNINYTIPVHDGTRKLLEDVSGYVAPGKLTALVGSSGAGKACDILYALCAAIA